VPLTQIEAFHRPPDLDAAWQLLREGGHAVRLVGGGTDLVVACPDEVTTLVDLAGCGLDRIEVGDEGGLRLGAMATFSDLLDHPAVRAHATGVLAEALGQVGSVLHRNSATLGGHLARQRLSDVVPVLLALDAQVLTYDGAEQIHDLSAYLADPWGPHVVTEVRLPPASAGTGAAFVRFTRTRFDYAIVNGCARVDLDDGRIDAARIAVGQTGVLGHRLPVAEEVLAGAEPTPATFDAAATVVGDTINPHDDWVASADYRRHLAGVAVARTLREAVRRTAATAGGGA
jgi:aerobic carbon-monoxide dehydrogenase medium subunit